MFIFTVMCVAGVCLCHNINMADQSFKLSTVLFAFHYYVRPAPKIENQTNLNHLAPVNLRVWHNIRSKKLDENKRFDHPGVYIGSSSLGFEQSGVLTQVDLPKHTVICAYPFDLYVQMERGQDVGMVQKFNDYSFNYPTSPIAQWTLDLLKDVFVEYAKNKNTDKTNINWYRCTATQMFYLETNCAVKAGQELFKPYGMPIWLHLILIELFAQVTVSAAKKLNRDAIYRLVNSLENNSDKADQLCRFMKSDYQVKLQTKRNPFLQMKHLLATAPFPCQSKHSEPQ